MTGVLFHCLPKVGEEEWRQVLGYLAKESPGTGLRAGHMVLHTALDFTTAGLIGDFKFKVQT